MDRRDDSGWEFTDEELVSTVAVWNINGNAGAARSHGRGSRSSEPCGGEGGMTGEGLCRGT
ncbi:hypothetical protein E2562_030160 [Oryza meyeriana var. granulata]|uniref:Uncharacterized protein n=1 Tax=Oryza meyeriana var. granulata TaxID=110450 RepID=A0A6G1BPC5_9ORYZ|nr:hypothetical protein E2562_030160 [Oryza meyeriana var. granulata]